MKVKIIENCPSCSSTLERVNDQLFCRNPTCEAKSNKKVIHFIKALKIKGLGEKTVEKLNICSISDIYNLNKDFSVSVIGEKLTEKLFDEINKSKFTDLATFISAFGIPLVGKAIASKLEGVKALREITYDKCISCGIGDKASRNLSLWAETFDLKEYPITIEFPDGSKPSQDKKDNFKICVTGKISNYSRTELSALLKPAGITIMGSISKNIKYLVSDENKTSSKHTKAKGLGIEIITFKQLIELEKLNEYIT